MFAWINAQPNVALGLHDQKLVHNGAEYTVRYDTIGGKWWASEGDRALSIEGAESCDREKVKAAVEFKARHDRPENKDGDRCRGCGRDWYRLVHGC
ncbi:hypothetical protein PBI_VALIDUS_101 [Mycobacterium phage Validus]|uniref:Uncharacterized protein n=1 Tax=Mycobacterium phage Validus TaxID=1414747 RepID=V5UQ16_9CAUD|nr:hypothetical protein CC50_gp010 [Mycobacterium phage Validus]AHB79631.1 hypothetical protein PBI_VALIDUS_101 [Mycobacterium phage Validus]